MSGLDHPLGPSSSLVSVSTAALTRPPPPLNSPLSVLRGGPGLPLVGDLRQMDRFSFLRRALLASRPAAVVDTILTCYCPSTYRQQEVTWAAFQRWLPRTNATVSKDVVLCFLQDLFKTNPLCPALSLNHRAVLHWPLEEAFDIDYSHPDFSRLVTGFFYLHPPAVPVVPQWNLSEVLHFYDGVDHHSFSSTAFRPEDPMPYSIGFGESLL